ncbi:MAG: fibronectin type III domain-containing protein [Dehalococcoidia bacterium]|nr:MAG: fibronectin type III domain-containing protein [Dehalococcoidia bacterium]
MPEVPKVKLLRQIIVGLICLLFLVSPVFSFAADTQLELQMSPFPAPSNLTATVISTDQINLNWSPVSGAISYKVYRDGILIASLTETSYSDTGLTPGKTYSYAVSGVNADGVESQSSSVSATTPGVGGGLPPAAYNPPTPPGWKF